MEVYFQIHGVANDIDKISFARLKMSGHALVWWESYVETYRDEQFSKISFWNVFKNLLRDQFYPLGYHDK